MLISKPIASELATVVWGASSWRIVAIPAVLLLLILVAAGYRRVNVGSGVRVVAIVAKTIGILILSLALLEPLFSGTRARPGANLFIVLADNSQSMTLRDRGAKQSRSEQLTSLVPKGAGWLTKIGQDFDLRQYSFDTQLHTGVDLQKLPFDGAASNLGAALQRLARQYHGRPLAGIMLMTDGTATDPDVVERAIAQQQAGDDQAKLPPVYSVMLGQPTPADDINLQNVAVSQTNFEDAPVTLAAQIVTSGFRGQTLIAQVLDETGKAVDQQKVTVDQDGEPITTRFRIKPDQAAGISFYRVTVAASSSDSTQPSETKTAEATLANNTRLVAVDRGKGPYRVLYVSGRPNWEFKFLQRALATDEQVQLVGLIRVAKREPKFNYINAGDRANPLFRGFKDADSEQVEQYDQPVMVRVGTEDQDELRNGFPHTPEELYRYHAIIIGDLESDFFTQDQMLLIKNFVAQRGGGLLMLGGQESFKEGKYDRTPIGDLLPVYLDNAAALPEDARFRLVLSREGWLEPWVRLRPEEPAERQRLLAMPPFMTMNETRAIKPGATVLASVQVQMAQGDTVGETVPALVEQRFGRGRAAAMMLGDMWRWTLRREEGDPDDLPKAWRQAVRWLVSEVPQRVEVAVTPRHEADDPDGLLSLAVRVRDPSYGAQDNATVSIHVTSPDGKSVDLPAEASAREAGLYEAVYVPRQAGAYRADVTATGPDGKEIAEVQGGWAADPAADEFRDLKPNRALLDSIAKRTGGEMVAAGDLAHFAETLPTRHVDITEPYVRPIWHQPWVLLLAIACLTTEWGLRRWKGLP
jgi:uncharacterized membrane protein